MDSYEYDLCLSFAGEDRAYVEEVAQHLRKAGKKIFYDQYEKASLWGKDLYQHLDSVYREKAMFCMIFVSSAYAKKLWTKHELKAAQARAFREHKEYILPVRLDATEIPGLFETTGYIDGSTHLPSDIAELFILKLDEAATLGKVTSPESSNHLIQENDLGVPTHELKEKVQTLSPSILANEYLERSLDRYHVVTGLSEHNLPNHGSWETSFSIDGPLITYTPNIAFLNFLDSKNPNITGWPPWINSTKFSNNDSHPRFHEGSLEAFIVSLKDTDLFHGIDFWRISTSGEFYLYRALEDDISNRPNRPEPFSCLDFYLPIIRTFEAIAVSIEFGKALTNNTEGSSISICFRWKGIGGRQLTSWANQMRMISPGRTSLLDDIQSHLNIPLNSSMQDIAETHIIKSIKPLFDAFNDDPNVEHVISPAIISEICFQFLNSETW